MTQDNSKFFRPPKAAASRVVAPAGHRDESLPRVLQKKNVLPQSAATAAGSPHREQRAAQLKSADPSPQRFHPSAPPVYRPLPTPRVLQTKSAPHALVHQVEVKGPLAAPPAYRPRPSVLAAKTTNGRLPVSGRAPVIAQTARPSSKPSALRAAPIAGQRSLQLKQRAAMTWAPKIVQKKSMSQQHPGNRPGAHAQTVIQRAADFKDEAEYPSLTAVVSKKVLKEIKKAGSENVKLQNEMEQKAKTAFLVKLATIEKLSRREGWWIELSMTDGSAGNKIRNGYGQIEGKSVHVTVVKARTTHPDLKTDSVATIVDKVLGDAKTADSVHTTLELNGKDHAENPRYFRNGDSPYGTQDQKAALRNLLDEFVAEATQLATKTKALL